MLGRAGWNVAADGLWGAPRVRVLAGQGRHGTIDRALRFLGVGAGSIDEVAMDEQGRMEPSALRSALAALPAPEADDDATCPCRRSLDGIELPFALPG